MTGRDTAVGGIVLVCESGSEDVDVERQRQSQGRTVLRRVLLGVKYV